MGAARTSAIRKPASRTVPERSPALEHLSLDALRGYRQALSEEEGRVSYWRRILQARLDLLEAGGTGKVDLAALRPVLAETRPGARRPAALTAVVDPGTPPLPDLATLWEREPGENEEARAELAAALADAETQLSAYRTDLHRRIADATAELIARYREEPLLCLTALPRPPVRAALR